MSSARPDPVERTLLEITELCSWYGEAQVLWNVAFAIQPSEGLGILGRNGAGKSTLLRTIAGVHRKATGGISFDGNPILGRPSFQIARDGLTLVREGAPVFAELSVVENVRLGAGLAADRRREPLEFAQIWEIFPALGSMQERLAGQLSGGQRQMLALATALASQPTVLLLDEPSAGLAPEAAATAFAAIAELRKTGLSVLIAEQNRDWLEGITTRSLELESGRIVATSVNGA
jgi:branched-chain amino acid transport system ATP-binding protein